MTSAQYTISLAEAEKIQHGVTKVKDFLISAKRRDIDDEEIVEQLDEIIGEHNTEIFYQENLADIRHTIIEELMGCNL